jgi:hypothetical protein
MSNIQTSHLDTQHQNFEGSLSPLRHKFLTESLLFIQLMHNYIALKMLKFTLISTLEVLLHVSAFHNNHQGATLCDLLKL